MAHCDTGSDMSEKLLTWTYCMRGSRNFCQWGGGGGGGPGPTARKQHFFSPQLILQFYNGLFQTKL